MGEKARTIKDLESSEPSVAFASGLLTEDLPNFAIEDDNLPLRELDLDSVPERVLVREPKVGGVMVRMGRLEVDVSGDWSDVEGLVLRTSRIGTEDREWVVWGASPSFGEVMETVDYGRVLE